MEKILIIKTGAAGDVVRTTSILQALQAVSVTWLTHNSCIPLFDPHRLENSAIYNLQDFPQQVAEQTYDLVLSLEENEDCAKLAGSLHTKKLTGIYWDNGLVYTKDSASWFDLSLVSVHGKQKANELKKLNQLSYQHHLFSMLGKSFNGEPYSIYQPAVQLIPGKIGIEATAGHRWPNKTWYGYSQLAEQLVRSGFSTVIFERKPLLHQYMEEIASCSLVISGDTLAMHLALAYQIPVLAIFNCTSPAEIYNYPCLQKMISPALSDYFYSTQNNPEAIRAIPVETVIRMVEIHWSRYYSMPDQTKEHATHAGFQS